MDKVTADTPKTWTQNEVETVIYNEIKGSRADFMHRNKYLNDERLAALIFCALNEHSLLRDTILCEPS
jgi:hypothetical protein